MIRTQVQLEEKQVETLKQLAAQRRESIAELIRRAIDLYIEEVRKPQIDWAERRQRAILVAGKFHSTVPDLSINHDEYFAEAIENYPRRTLPSSKSEDAS